MTFFKNLFGNNEKTATKPEKPARPASPANTYAWSYFDNAASGVRLPYPRNWITSEQAGKILIHEASPHMLPGGILEIGMTLVMLNTSKSALAGADDLTICKHWMETMIKNSAGTLEWSEPGKIPTGQPAIWYGYRFPKAGANLKAVCVAAHKRGSLYYLDVTGRAELVDARIEEWKAIIHALEVRK